MPRQKDLKRLVRTRMNKTGESYTSARLNLTHKRTQPTVPESDYPDLAGMSDEAVRKKTGKTWKQWVSVLDAVDAHAMPHRDIAKHIYDSYPDVDGWWAQTVTVGYERIRGLRDVGQRRGGLYEANKSKTFPVPVARLYRAFSTARTRRRWLPDVDLRIRTSRKEKSMRITWPDGTDVHANFVDKGSSKSQVAIQHAKLSSKADIAKMKAYWAERFDVLKELL